jgi:DNA invertase Pin-like site-specific DNA recombinase
MARARLMRTCVFSTASQQSGHGLVRQKQDCQRTAAALGLQLDDADIMVDMASAYTGQNLAAGKLGKFIDDVEAGQIPTDVTLIVESVDRLSRQGIKDSLPLLFKLHKLGLRLYVTEQSQFFDADLQSTIVAAVNLERAQNESKLKSVRMQAVWAAKANSCSAPITAKSPSWVELLPDRSGFRLIPEKAAVVTFLALDADGSRVTNIDWTISTNVHVHALMLFHPQAPAPSDLHELEDFRICDRRIDVVELDRFDPAKGSLLDLASYCTKGIRGGDVEGISFDMLPNRLEGRDIAIEAYAQRYSCQTAE